jgi:hypothetical protein
MAQPVQNDWGQANRSGQMVTVPLPNGPIDLAPAPPSGPDVEATDRPPVWCGPSGPNSTPECRSTMVILQRAPCGTPEARGHNDCQQWIVRPDAVMPALSACEEVGYGSWWTTWLCPSRGDR